MKIISSDEQERILTLSIDAVRNAYALDVVAEPYGPVEIGQQIGRSSCL